MSDIAKNHARRLRDVLPEIKRPKRLLAEVELTVDDPDKARQKYLDRLDRQPCVIALQRVVDGLWSEAQYRTWLTRRAPLKPLAKRSDKNALWTNEDQEYEDRRAHEAEVYARNLARTRVQRDPEENKRYCREYRARKRAEGRGSA